MGPRIPAKFVTLPSLWVSAAFMVSIARLILRCPAIRRGWVRALKNLRGEPESAVTSTCPGGGWNRAAKSHERLKRLANTDLTDEPNSRVTKVVRKVVYRIHISYRRIIAHRVSNV